MFQYRTRDGGDAVVPIIYLPAAASQTIPQGCPVEVDAGLINTGAAGDDAFVGVSNKAYTSTTAGDLIELILALPDVIFEVDYVGSTKTSLTLADLGTAFDLSASDPTVIDLDDSTGGAWVCVGFDNTKKTALVKLLRSKASPIAS